VYYIRVRFVQRKKKLSALRFLLSVFAPQAYSPGMKRRAIRERLGREIWNKMDRIDANEYNID
jgi:hypothetical protein